MTNLKLITVLGIASFLFYITGVIYASSVIFAIGGLLNVALIPAWYCYMKK